MASNASRERAGGASAFPTLATPRFDISTLKEAEKLLVLKMVIKCADIGGAACGQVWEAGRSAHGVAACRARVA